jgi:hypothetical protein
MSFSSSKSEIASTPFESDVRTTAVKKSAIKPPVL